MHFKKLFTKEDDGMEDEKEKELAREEIIPFDSLTFWISYQSDSSPTVTQCCAEILNSLRSTGIVQVIFEDDPKTIQKNLRDLRAILENSLLDTEIFSEEISFQEKKAVPISGFYPGTTALTLNISLVVNIKKE